MIIDVNDELIRHELVKKLRAVWADCPWATNGQDLAQGEQFRVYVRDTCGIDYEYKPAPGARLTAARVVDQHKYLFFLLRYGDRE